MWSVRSIAGLIVVPALLLVIGCANTPNAPQGVKYLDNGYYDAAMAYLSLDNGDQDKAIAESNQVQQNDPNDATAYYNRGTAYLDKEAYDLSITDYNKAIELRPDYWQAYANRGVAHFRIEDYEKAIADQTRALEISPWQGITYNNRARAYYATQQYARAWDDAMMAQRLRFMVDPEFLYELRQATGRDL